MLNKKLLDIIGDIHGCYDELEKLLTFLGHRIYENKDEHRPKSVAERQLVFVGDIINRGPHPLKVLDLVRSLHDRKQAIVIMGNHECEFLAWCDGKAANTYRLEPTIEQFITKDPSYRNSTIEWLRTLPDHVVLDNGQLCVAHAGLHQEDHNKFNAKTKKTAIFGHDLNADESRSSLHWAETYKGKALVVHGHVPRALVTEKNGVWNLDTGCCFGGQLSALRYPELEIVSIPSEKIYAPLPEDFYF